MTDKELKRLSRAELLSLLLVQTKEVERLRHEVEKVREQLEDRQLYLKETGNLARAVLDINGVMEAAQAAADQYLENIAEMEAATRRKCDRMLQEAAQEAQRLRYMSSEDMM